MRRLAATTLVVLLGVAGLATPAGAADTDHDGVGNRRDLCPTIAATSADGCPRANWALNNLDGPPRADTTLSYGSLGWQPVGGNWGYGESIGAYDRSTGWWHLRDTICPCSSHVDFRFDVAVAGPHYPLAGDWDGDGIDGVGVYLPSTGAFYLRDDLTTGGSQYSFSFGGPHPARYVRPVAGDWNGDGIDTVGVFRRDTDRWRLTDANSPAPSAIGVFKNGRPGSTELPIAGDWDGDGKDSIGLMEEEGIFYLRNSNSFGEADVTFTFGGGHGARPVAGNWDLDSQDDVGVQRR